MFILHMDSRFGHTPNPAPRCHHPSRCFTVDIVRCQFGRHRPTLVLYLFFINIFLFFSRITQHSIQNITKQNNRHILNISKSSQKGGREGRTTKTQKSLLHTITYIKQKTLPSVNGRRPSPTDSRRCTFTSHYLQEAMDPICFSTHV